jgi:hypothetical protein
VTSKKRNRRRVRVDLPLPVAPTKATVLEGGARKETCREGEGEGGGAAPRLLRAVACCCVSWRGVAWRAVVWRGVAWRACQGVGMGWGVGVARTHARQRPALQVHFKQRRPPPGRCKRKLSDRGSAGSPCGPLPETKAAQAGSPRPPFQDAPP